MDVYPYVQIISITSFSIKGTVMQIEQALIKDRLCIVKVS